MGRTDTLALGLVTAMALSCGGRTPLDDTYISGGTTGSGGAGASATGVGGFGGSVGGFAGAGGFAGGTTGTGTGGSSVGSGGGVTGSGGASGTGGLGTGGAGTTGSGAGGSPAGGSGGGGGFAGTGAAGTGGGSTGVGGSAMGGFGGATGGTNSQALVTLLVGSASPPCLRCVDNSCPVVDQCAARASCFTGLACAVKCPDDSVQCQIGCFRETESLVNAISTVACVFETCGRWCGSRGSF